MIVRHRGFIGDAASANARMNALIAPSIAKDNAAKAVNDAARAASDALFAANLAIKAAADAKSAALAKGTADARAACLAAEKVANDAKIAAIAAAKVAQQKLDDEAVAKVTAGAALAQTQAKLKAQTPAGDGGMYAMPGELYAKSAPEEAVRAAHVAAAPMTVTDKVSMGVQVVGGLFLVAQIARFFMKKGA